MQSYVYNESEGKINNITKACVTLLDIFCHVFLTVEGDKTFSISITFITQKYWKSNLNHM